MVKLAGKDPRCLDPPIIWEWNIMITLFDLLIKHVGVWNQTPCIFQNIIKAYPLAKGYGER